MRGRVYFGDCTSLRLLKSRERVARMAKKSSNIREMCKCIYPGWPAHSRSRDELSTLQNDENAVSRFLVEHL